ncbi:MAG: winged helix DNA-binding domain-containing protein [Bacteroidetes bacterium]|nr:winged helix DNA-binding domain-containing protein [Bacteroidota bacterium]
MHDNIKFRHWSYKRQQLGKQGAEPIQVLKDIIGVYSWHPSAALSLYARLKSFGEADFYKLETSKAALRMPSMRLSVHMLPAGTAAQIFAATVPPASDPIWEKRYSQPGRKIPSEKYSNWRSLILKTVTKPLTASEIKERTDIPDELTKFLLNRMGYEGDILRIGAESLKSNIVSYVATRSWAKETLNRPGNEEALSWLAAEYLRAFGPARIKDFQWWAGITATKAKAAIAANDIEDIGNTYLLLRKDLNEYEHFKTPKIDSIDLLPQWDSYIMGYAPDGRARFVSPDMQNNIYGALGATAGNGLGTVLINGLAHGAWNTKFTGNKMAVTLNMFEKVTAKASKEIEAQFESMAMLIHAKTISFQKK